MKLSTKSRYSARILIELARHHQESPLKTGKISSKQDIPLKYLEQLITVLRKSGYIKSFRGPKGGHKLVIDPSKIMLGHIVRLFEGQTNLVECVTPSKTCNLADECRLRLAWQEATEVLYQRLDRISIASLLERPGGKEPGECCHPSEVIKYV